MLADRKSALPVPQTRAIPNQPTRGSPTQEDRSAPSTRMVTGASQQEELVKVGYRGNVLVRKTDAEARAEMRGALQWSPPAPDESRRAVRERENAEALGGLRNPWLAVDKVPGLRTMGAKIREAFNRVVAKFPKVLRLADTLGCLLYTSPSPRDGLLSRMPSSA